MLMNINELKYQAPLAWVVSHSGNDLNMDSFSLGTILTWIVSHSGNDLKMDSFSLGEQSIMIGKSDCTVRQWWNDFIKGGEPVHSGVLWSSEELNKKATRYIRENANT
jgi:hypothetical protein